MNTIINIISIGIGVIILIYSIVYFRRTYYISRTRSYKWWIVLVIFILFYIAGYTFFGYYLVTGSELLDLRSLVSQVFLWGSVFVAICARLFFATTESKNLLLEQRLIVEDKMKRSEEKYRSVVESTDDSIYMVDRKCNYLFINSNHMARLGLKDFRGKNYSDCHLKNQADRFSDSIARIFDTGKREQQEYEFRGRWFLQTLNPFKDQKTKEIMAVTVISTDITNRKKVDELSAENMSLEYASRAKSGFLAVMSHELRTPLNSIIGFSELLKGGVNGELNQKQQHYIDNVIVSGKFLLDLISDILDLSKVEAGKIDIINERISVPIIIRETLDLVREIAKKKNVVIEKELDPQLDFIETDRQRLKQLLFNILSNAIKFSKNEGGTVTIKTKKEGCMAKFSISDTGIGIKEEDMGRLFRRFEQLDSGITRQYGGTGLGLAISRKLLELMGGNITVESVYDIGSTFTFILPLAVRNENI